MRFGKFALAGLLVLAASSAKAQITVYTDLASFQAAAGSTTLEDFSSSAFNTTGAFGPMAYNGFSLTGDGLGNNIGVHNGAVANSGDNHPIPAAFDGQNFFGWGDGGTGGAIAPLTITFDQPITAFGFDWFDTDDTDQYQITFAPSAPGGSTYSGPPFTAGGTSGFFGVVSATPLTSATISNLFNGGYISDEGFDNVRISGETAAVPEPGSVALLIGAGAAGAAFLRRRKQAA